MPTRPDSVILWLPRGDEHELAASLGLCERDPDLLRQLITAAQETLAADLPGSRVRVYRWHVWRVVRALARTGGLNTPDGRATAFAFLARSSEQSHEQDDDRESP